MSAPHKLLLKCRTGIDFAGISNFPMHLAFRLDANHFAQHLVYCNRSYWSSGVKNCSSGDTVGNYLGKTDRRSMAMVWATHRSGNRGPMRRAIREIR